MTQRRAFRRLGRGASLLGTRWATSVLRSDVTPLPSQPCKSFERSASNINCKESNEISQVDGTRRRKRLTSMRAVSRGMSARSIARIPRSSNAAMHRRSVSNAPSTLSTILRTQQSSQPWSATKATFGKQPPLGMQAFRSTYLTRSHLSVISSDKRWFSDQKATETSPPETPSTAEVATEAAEQSTSTVEEEAPSTPGSSKEEELEMEIRSLKDQLLRSLADQDNTRRIAQRDIESARQFAIKSFAKSLLDVSDNLTRALEAVPKDEVEDAKGTTLATLYEGIEMTERGLNKAFEMNGLIKYGAEGEPFDPNQHEALFEYPDPSKQAGTVGQVMKAGFMLNKRVLRPAEVGVVKNNPE